MATMPEVQVSASADDAYKSYAGIQAGFYNNSVTLAVGSVGSDAVEKQGSIGWIFRNVQIPQGADIQTAIISVYASFDQFTDPKTRIRGYDGDDASGFDFSTEAEWDAIFPGSLTTAKVTWDDPLPNWGGTPGWFSLPDISTVIEEIVGRGGWSSGNDLVVFWDDYEGRSASGNRRQPASYDYLTNIYGAKFNCSYSLGSGQVILF